MTVKELIKELEKHPKDMLVFIAERKTEYTYGLLNSVSTNVIDLIDEDTLREDDDVEVLILDEC